MISLEKYSDKCYAVFGDTKEHKDQLKELGGKFNNNLKGRPGWVFHISKKDTIEKFVSDKCSSMPLLYLNSPILHPLKTTRSLFNTNTDPNAPPKGSSLSVESSQEKDGITIEDYSVKSFAVFGNTKEFKDKLAELGGKYNPNLKGQAGWVFSNKNRPNVDEWYKNTISVVDDDMETVSTIDCSEVLESGRKMVPKRYKFSSDVICSDDDETPIIRLLRK